MAFNYLVYIQSSKDSSVTNSPLQNVFKWTREAQGIPSVKAESLEFALAPGESKTLFSGTRTLQQDGTTQYSLQLKSGTTNTYQLSHVGGTAPEFRTPRTTGADATTQVTVTKSANVITLTSTGGTAFSFILGGVVVGDYVFIGSAFNAANQGRYQIISVTATSISFVNSGGAAQGPVTLGVSFANQVRVYSAAGVQVADKLNIFGGFSPASYGIYSITAVQDNLIEFYSGEALPAQTVTTEDIVIYSMAKKFVYLETDQKVDITINGTLESPLEPFNENGCKANGIFLKKSTVWSMTVQNNGSETANLYHASVE